MWNLLLFLSVLCVRPEPHKAPPPAPRLPRLQDLEDNESDGASTPAPGSPRSDLAALSVHSQSDEPALAPAEDGDGPESSAAAEAEPDAVAGVLAAIYSLNVCF